MMNKSTVIVLTSCVLVSLFLRVVLPHNAIFTEVGIKFSGNDAYYHMMIVDQLLASFPHINQFTSDIPATFFHYLLFGIIWIAGFGHPSPHSVDVIGVFFPAILGVLTIFPVYFLGKELFGVKEGLISAGLIAVLPGEFLGRSILGFTDHDILLTFLTTLTMLFLVRGIKTQRKWHGVISGMCLGMFLLTWYGGLLFIFIIDLYVLVQVLLDHFHRKPSKYLLWTITSCLVVSTAIYHLDWTLKSNQIILFASCGLPAFLVYVSHILKDKSRAILPTGILGIGAIGLLAVYLADRSLFNSIASSSSLFFSGTSPSDVTTSEMKPLFYPNGTFTLQLVSNNFNVSFLAFVAGLGILSYGLKDNRPDLTLLVIWSAVILFGTIEHRRFASFLAVNVALLSGYVGMILIKAFGGKV